MPKPWHQRRKALGAKLVLSWFAPRRCWKKYHSGEVKYFKHPNSSEGYEAAVLEYHAWLHRQKQTRPLGAEYEHHIQVLRQCLKWHERFGTPEDEEAFHPEMPNKQMKYLRKTGSSKIRSDRRFLSLDSLYLGHSWATIADKHYNVFDGRPYPPLDEALEWLGHEFRIL